MKSHLYKYIYAILASSTSLFLYMSFVKPDIEVPLTVLGFFTFVALMIFSLLLPLVTWKLSKYPRYLLSGLLTLSFIYLLALHTIRVLDWIDIAIVVVVLTLMIQLMVVPKKR